ncbi:PTS galactosamine/N-acetylgalactosamine transporter subunit IIA [Risungbinella massiliensis]|uniref:PTS galactosamine/N-acetylgalactosamine transporter subunit IIA n=1 Tax=Risungbinella massiliensis TaxID=1329796 RepID=UPI0005CBF823|nr:PTS galactosamine/N-acetylgalactosamine transporter subunit IIA [Risungbinella massiliensis]
MNGIIVTGHGHFATGLGSSLKLIAGEQLNIKFVDFVAEDSTEQLREKILQERLALKDCDGVLVLCDLVGGSPFQTAVLLSNEDPKIKVVGGTNLAMLVELALWKETKTLEELTSLAVSIGKDAVQAFELQDRVLTEPEEDGI